MVKFGEAAPAPSWIRDAAPLFFKRMSDELSIICPERFVPADAAGHRCSIGLQAGGEVAFDQVGVAAAVRSPLVADGISLILVGTHDRDYNFVPGPDRDYALRRAGFLVFGP